MKSENNIVEGALKVHKLTFWEAAMIIVGIMFFTLGAEMSMTPMGERVGSMLTRSQNLFLIIGVGFLLGFLITISEPDLQVLANQVPSIPNMTLILSVAAGVGIFLVMAFLRMLLGIPLPRLLVIFYAVIFLLAAFVPKEFLAVAFDSGGVTTGPMTGVCTPKLSVWRKQQPVSVRSPSNEMTAVFLSLSKAKEKCSLSLSARMIVPVTS